MFNKSEFDKRFARNQRRFDIMFRVVSVIIGIVFIAVIAGWIFAGTVAYKAVDAVEEQGLKSVIENIWCGKDQKCL